MTFCAIVLLALATSVAAVDYADNASVRLFQEYLRINTTTGNDLDEAVNFWKDRAADLDLPISVYNYSAGYPVVVIRWAGSDSTLGSIMLNSHMDVVPADGTDWTYPPFNATLDANGTIWGRGTQDMKSVSIQYFEALKQLKENNVTLLRDVYMTLMPDEEVGGANGMISFMESDEFAAMNVAFEMDESAASPFDEIYALFYQDKAVWQIQVDCVGVSAHSGVFPATNTTAIGKCRNVIDKFLDFRDEQYNISTTNSIYNSGAYTSVNLNRMNAGTANNVVPDRVSLVFDIRLGTSVNTTSFLEQLETWLSESGDNVTLTFLEKDEQAARVIANSTNPFYTAINSAATALNMTILPIVSPGATDARHLRTLGIPAFGFTPMSNTPTLLHAIDERLSAEVFLSGIDKYVAIIEKLANIAASVTKSLAPGSLVVQSVYE